MLVETLTGAAMFAVVLYLYLTWNYSHWSRKGLVCVEPVLPGVGNFLDLILLKKSATTVQTEMYKRFAGHSAVGFYHFRQPALLVRDPDIIQQVLVTSFSKFHDNYFKVCDKLEPLTAKNAFFVDGPKWKESRLALAPAFTVNKTKTYFLKMQELCDKLVQYLENHVNKDIEAKRVAYLFTTDVVSSCGFGIASNAVSGEETMFIKYGKLLASGFESESTVLFYLPFASKLLSIRIVPTTVCRFVEEIVHTVINYRKKNNVIQNDYLHLLLKKKEKTLLEAKPNDKSAQEQSQTVLLGHALTFFMEGFEGSSNVISFIMYELAMNTDIQEKLRKELNDAASDKQLDYGTLMQLPYLNKVVSETLRKHSVSLAMTKICTESTTLTIDGKLIDIEAGTPIVIPIYALHNDPKYFPNPEKFDPERFSEENIAQRHHYCYLPFGGGPRICVGMRFALAQIKSFAANILMNYRIVRGKKTADKLTFKPKTMMLVSNEGIWICLEKLE